MADDDTFTQFIGRIRAGDQDAAAELVRRFEPFIRREARLRMRSARLSRLFDSTDICQSVLAGFFVRAALGEYDLDQPDNLVKLLAGMVTRKVAFQVRKHHAQRRDVRLQIDANPAETAAPGASPSRVLAGRDLLREFRQRLTVEERALADLRAEGCPWSDIAARLGGTAKARCKQLARALSRVARELDMDDGNEEDE